MNNRSSISLDHPTLKDLVNYFDITAQMFCAQISEDYLKFIKKTVLPNLPVSKKLNYREIKIITLLSSGAKTSYSSSEIGNIFRLDPATMTRAVKRLEDFDMVETSKSLADNRVKNLTPRPQSLALTKLYRAFCAEATLYADQSGVVPLDDKEVNEILESLYELKDRAAKFRGIDFARPPPVNFYMQHTDPAYQKQKRTILNFYDFGFQIFAHQISVDYLKFLKAHVISKLQALGDLGNRELRVLMCVNFYQNPISPSDIAKVMRYDPATVTRAVAALKTGGYIKLIANQFDTRSHHIFLTDMGRILAKEYSRKSTKTIQKAEEFLEIPESNDNKRKILKALILLKKRSEALARLKPPATPLPFRQTG